MKGGKKVGEPKSKFANFQAQKPTCPHCGSIIYSRRNVLCGVCGERLPKELLFSAEERATVEKELKDAKKRAISERSPWDGNAGSPQLFNSTDFGSA